MKPRNGAVVALLFLATCSEELNDHNSSNRQPQAKALGTVPPTEVAVWQKLAASSLPEGRYLQAVAFDSSRGVLVMFGGMIADPNTGGYLASRETWEWSPKTSKWTQRVGTGTAPEARSGAGMVFDSGRGKLVLFGGRAGSGFDLEDTWEWDPMTGVWTNLTAAGSRPTARSQHGMVYETSTGKILLFGGGRSDIGDPSGMGVTASLGDTWEYDPVAYTWKQLSPAASPSVRHDFGLVWDKARGRAVLFGGMQSDVAGASGVPKQDTWEWDPESSLWTERTTVGAKPSQRYGHAMAYDGKRGRVLLFGGFDIGTAGSLNDLWELEPTTFAWTQRLTGAETGVPTMRLYASLVADDISGLLLLVAGLAAFDPYGTGGPGGIIGGPIPIDYGMVASREVWELDPVKPAFTDRSAELDVPSARALQAMAYSPALGKTYLFGGCDYTTGIPMNDLWEWDGKVWTKVAADSQPPPRCGAGLAYDPVRKSLILFGGIDYYNTSMPAPYNDTWELGPDKKWTQLKPTRSPEGLSGHGMVTDTTRGKILLFSGERGYVPGDVYPPIFPPDPYSTDVWEWDGAAVTWTNRTSPAGVNMPGSRSYPMLTYDEGRQKMFLFDGLGYGGSDTSYWEWDPITAGWANLGIEGLVSRGIYFTTVAYDSIRRRQVLLGDSTMVDYGGEQSTCEIDTKSGTLYLRTLSPTPNNGYGGTMVFDSIRGVMVLYGGQDSNTGAALNYTWEYRVTNLGNGEGCTPAFASSCASGFCVEGVCCNVAACTGACKSCNVPGAEGTCVLAAPGTEVPGSCAEGKSCDATGACKSKNGQPCTATAECASGLCVEGVCCDSACTGECKSCNQPGRMGKCTAFPAGTDPQAECGRGTGVCKSTCDGVGACAFPQPTVSCADCLLCNGAGECTIRDYTNIACVYGGTGGRPYPYGTGGRPYGTGGYIPNLGGSGGYVPAGGRPYGTGGRGDTIPIGGGHGGGPAVVGGRGGGIPVAGGVGGGIPVLGGTAGRPPVLGGLPVAGGGAGIPVGSGGQARLGGATGYTPGRGGSLANDGGPGPRDAPGEAAGPTLHKSGCGCALGSRGMAGSGLGLPLLLAGAVWSFRRRYRRHS